VIFSKKEMCTIIQPKPSSQWPSSKKDIEQIYEQKWSYFSKFFVWIK
jgi:hypothetical protein